MEEEKKGILMYPFEDCKCKDNKSGIAIAQISTAVLKGSAFLPEELSFLTTNKGKLICFFCGGKVPYTKENLSNADHISGGTVLERLREIHANK